MSLCDVISDIHTETFYNYTELNKCIREIEKKKISTILVLAGDIGNIKSSFYFYFLTCMAKLYDHVLLISGNHDIYDFDIIQGYKELKKMCNKINDIVDNNLYFLNRDVVHIDDFIFVGCTLWTNVSDIEHYNVYHKMNDYCRIKNFNVHQQNRLHSIDRKWLLNTVPYISGKQEYCDKTIIVVTHHAPSVKLIPQKYIKSKINSAFVCSDIPESLFKHIDYWVYGHIHIPQKHYIHQCTFISNPLGYENENNILTLKTLSSQHGDV